jgi:hypothetical protein
MWFRSPNGAISTRGVFVMSLLLVAAFALATAALVTAEPVVSGKVTTEEFANSNQVMDGAATFSRARDGKGGLTMALVAKNT